MLMTCEAIRTMRWWGPHCNPPVNANVEDAREVVWDSGEASAAEL